MARIPAYRAAASPVLVSALRGVIPAEIPGEREADGERRFACPRREGREVADECLRLSGHSPSEIRSLGQESRASQVAIARGTLKEVANPIESE